MSTTIRPPDASASPQRGSVSVELVVLTPVLIALMVFVVFLGRAGGAFEQVRHAADVAARAASLRARPLMAITAREAASSDLARNGVNCGSTTVDVTVSAAAPGRDSFVTVTVSCVVNADGLAMLGVDGTTLTARSTEIVDRYRGGS